MFKLTVLYPNSTADHFDLDYYLNTHKALVEKLLNPEGLVKIEIEEGIAGGAPGTDATFSVIGALFFPDSETLEKAVDKHALEIMFDMPNFTNVTPVIQMSRVV